LGEHGYDAPPDDRTTGTFPADLTTSNRGRESIGVVVQFLQVGR
jgi:hypothetical protein